MKFEQEDPRWLAQEFARNIVPDVNNMELIDVVETYLAGYWKGIAAATKKESVKHTNSPPDL